MLNWRYKFIYITLLLLIGNLQGCCIINKLASATSSLSSKEAKYITIYAKISYQEKDKSPSCNLKLQIHRDTLIGFSVTHIWGIEFARGIITPTGIELINHIDKTYTKYDYKTLENIWQLPCSYNILQAALLGELPNAYTKIISQEKTITQDFCESLAIRYKKTNRLHKLAIRNTLTNHTLQVVYNYEDKRCTKNVLFQEAKAYFGTISVNLQYRKVQLNHNPFTFYFKIPQQYDKI